MTHENVINETVNKVMETIDKVYNERNRVVAALSKLFPASIEIDPKEPEWKVVIIDIPTGQVSWHVAKHEMHMFAHLEHGKREWDGHDTEEKYRRLGAISCQVKEYRPAIEVAKALHKASSSYFSWEDLPEITRAKYIGYAVTAIHELR